MIQILEIDDFLQLSNGHLTLDVRSEGEYADGKIFHATNLPLFNNEERASVGTAYKQLGKKEAIVLGLEFAGKKMPEFAKFLQKHAHSNKIFVHCWRGGMRSESMAWLFNLLDYEVFILQGGYKSFRNYVQEILARNFNFLVVGGRTGSGKTAILNQLESLGEQVIDFEGLANHKGSAFGALGLPPQPTTEHFENLLGMQLKNFDIGKRVWVEDESRGVGKIFINQELWNHLCVAPSFIINLPFEIRVRRLVQDYGENHTEGLEKAIHNIKKRLGLEGWQNSLAALLNKDFAEVARITLGYYDKLYDKGIANKINKDIVQLEFESDQIDVIAQQLIEAVSKKSYGYEPV